MNINFKILNQFSSNYKVAIKGRKKLFKVTYKSSLIILLKFLHKNNYILNYVTDKDKRYIYVYIKYNNYKPLVYDFKILCKVGKVNNIPARNILQNKFSYLTIISTKKGIMFNTTAAILNIGGVHLIEIRI